MVDSSSLALMAHVATGTIAVAAGTIALLVRKGAPVHVAVGRMFAVTMALSSALGAVLGLLKFDSFYITFHAGVLGTTLILSGWMTARAREGRLAGATAAVAGINAANMAALIAAGAHALNQPDRQLFQFAAEDYFFLAGMAGLCVPGDVSLLVRRNLSSPRRIARHLWRMMMGFFIAAGSAFTGPGAAVFPEAVQQSGLLSLPELVIILLMVFWLVRVLMFRSTMKRG